jgi:outer membrane protein insertion porin family
MNKKNIILSISKQLSSIICLLLFLPLLTLAQNNVAISIDYQNPKEYEIADIAVSGYHHYDTQVLIGLSGLSVGDKITLPGEETANIIKRFWKQGLFSAVRLEIASILDNKVWLNLHIDQLPKISEINIHGVKKSEKEDILKNISMSIGKELSANNIDRTTNYIRNYFIEKGFYLVDVSIFSRDNQNQLNTSIVDIYVNKHSRIKVDKLVIEGNNQLTTRKIDAVMKKTNDKGNIWNFFRSKKFIPAEYEKDKIALIEKYNEIGHRDARIVWDSVYVNNDKKSLTVHIRVDEGKKYYFGTISWLGNSVYSTDLLSSTLSIESMDVFNQKLLNQRIYDDEDGINNLYLNNGYLFFNLQIIESSVRDSLIDFEIRINEGKQARINRVNIVGSDILYENVVRRELRTKPGDLFSKADIMRSMREIGSTGHFATEEGKMDIQVNPNMSDGTVDLTYVLESKRNDQIELSAGYGQTSVVGILSLKFTNFSIQNLFDFSKYKPLPQGDGQTLTLKAQTNGSYYQAYSISFLEPWLGGKRPNSLSISAYYSVQSGVSSTYSSYANSSSYYSSTYDENSQNYWYASSYDPDKFIKTLGVSGGLGTRLNWPDDYFSIYGQASYQNYNLSNWDYFAFSTGRANNLNFTVTLNRNSLDQPIYTRSGSDFSVSASSTLPYSLFDGKDYSSMSDTEKYKWIEYYKIKFNAKMFTPLSSNAKLVLFSRAEYGFLGYFNKDKRSPFETFYVGGDGMTGYSSTYATETVSLRGYRNGSLTPYYDNGGQAGNMYSKLSLELRYPLLLEETSVIWALGFVEAGNAWKDFHNFNPFNLKRSAGVGIRLFMPMFGLLGIDWAYGFDKDNAASSTGVSGGQFHFVIGREF